MFHCGHLRAFISLSVVHATAGTFGRTARWNRGTQQRQPSLRLCGFTIRGAIFADCSKLDCMDSISASGWMNGKRKR